ncbi:MAG: threonine synthase [Chitinophagaceae bacterium]
MLYYSTNNNSALVDFKNATIKGQAPDGGLYFPERIPQLPFEFFNEIRLSSREEIAIEVIRPFVGDTIPEAELKRIVAETINFEFPLVKVDENTFSLELFHGPTLAFKDVGARFMSRCLGYFIKNAGRNITVLVATSGDTGGAVASGFYDVDGINVVILYPTGKVSSVQELQLTTYGKNITALEVNGNFDDCQHLVKQAFSDSELNTELFLTSANSINVARWLPQQFYYFFAYRQWAHKSDPPVISVPSGNFGNVCAGLLAHRSGLPVKHFVAACNANNIIPQYLDSGKYTPKQAVSTLSNAMDVGNPSNFVRILEIFNREFKSLKNVMSSYSISDDETKNILEDVYTKYQYLLDPHGAVAYCALKTYLADHLDEKGIFLETAHPVKFYDVVEPIIHEKVPIPDAVKELLGKKKESIQIEVNYKTLKQLLLASQQSQPRNVHHHSS